MKTYGFDFVGDDGQIRAVDVAEFLSEEEACRHARAALSARLTAVAVEIWEGGVRIARVDGRAPGQPALQP